MGWVVQTIKKEKEVKISVPKDVKKVQSAVCESYANRYYRGSRELFEFAGGDWLQALSSCNALLDGLFESLLENKPILKSVNNYIEVNTEYGSRLIPKEHASSILKDFIFKLKERGIKSIVIEKIETPTVVCNAISDDSGLFEVSCHGNNLAIEKKNKIVFDLSKEFDVKDNAWELIKQIGDECKEPSSVTKRLTIEKLESVIEDLI